MKNHLIIGATSQSGVLACVNSLKKEGSLSLLTKARDNALFQEKGLTILNFSGWIEVRNLSFTSALHQAKATTITVACGDKFWHHNVLLTLYKLGFITDENITVYFHYNDKQHSIAEIQEREGFQLFPLDITKRTHYAFEIDQYNRGWFTQFHNDQSEHPYFLPESQVEILKGSLIEATTEQKVTLEADSLLPVSFPSLSEDKIETNALNIIAPSGEEYLLEDLPPDRFHYLPFAQGGQVTIAADKPLILGESISRVQKEKTEVPLVLMLFVDGLAADIFKTTPMAAIMPNTANFFSCGTSFEQCFINGHWTLDSVPTFFLGKSPLNHNLFHPRKKFDISQQGIPISKRFQDSGFLTSAINTVPRLSAYNGFHKGFDRTIFQQHLNCCNLVDIVGEQITAFKKRSQFIFASIFDLHPMPYPVPEVSYQAKTSLTAHNYKRQKVRSIHMQYDGRAAERYRQQMHYIDSRLSSLYRLIENMYGTQAVVALVSDHGQAYLKSSDRALPEEFTRVPFLLRGPQVPQTQAQELIGNIDILPSILHGAGVNWDPEEFDGQLPVSLGGKKERPFTITEARYPGQHYRVVVRDKNHELHWETKAFVTEEGKVDLTKYRAELVHRHGGLATAQEKEKQWIQLILQRAAEIALH